MMKKTIVPVVLAGFWITLSEFVRNEFLLKKVWSNHFASLGLTFETLPVNGVLWMVWSFCLAFFLFRLLRYAAFKEAVALTWLVAFVMMWITIYNLQVLPLTLLAAAVPLSVVEVAVAGFVIRAFRRS